ncbi:hypothetical protein J6590_081736 [Homalodisca vitripennis]|nr:hypothetical protein J6590_081736 [Homalodisca vitripennis]
MTIRPSETKCEPSDLLQCLRPIGDSWAEDLPLICWRLTSVQRCIDGFTRDCFFSAVASSFHELHSRIKTVTGKICKAGILEEGFLAHARCLEAAIHTSQEDPKMSMLLSTRFPSLKILGIEVM